VSYRFIVTEWPHLGQLQADLGNEGYEGEGLDHPDADQCPLHLAVPNELQPQHHIIADLFA
jgi:hypothetical protein